MTSRPRALRTVLGAVAGLLVLAACGTTEPPAPAAPVPTTAAGPGSLTDSRGKQINLPSPAQRVVALEWNVAEHAVSLGVMPVGVADVTGYGQLGQGRAAGRLGRGRRGAR